MCVCVCSVVFLLFILPLLLASADAAQTPLSSFAPFLVPQAQSLGVEWEIGFE